jgi:tRNA(Ile)-lysidine synthase
MVEQFKSYLAEQRLLPTGANILLAVSGGIDSVVMTDLFHRLRIPFGIAHVNYHLRGKESDEDETFVRNLGVKYHVPVFIRDTQDLEFTEPRGMSVQMIAREIRYRWFEEVMDRKHFHVTATAHHLDDQIETFFINLLRGTGLAGLHGILPRQGRIIRPMLFTFRDEIGQYAREHNLPFREDSSNQSVKYLRNRIRHQLIPLLNNIQPETGKILSATIHRLRDSEEILSEFMSQVKESLINVKKDQLRINISRLRKLHPLDAWLFDILQPYGFNDQVIANLIRHLDNGVGKSFISPSHRIVIDRHELIVTPLPESGNENPPDSEYEIDKSFSEISGPVRLKFMKKRRTKNFRMNTARHVATLDYAKLEFPLILRRWKHGDSFYPYGLNRRKKLSDFLIDEKVSLPEKENTWLICSHGKIVWVVGHRIDHRFRITNRTTHLLVIERIN